MEDLCLDTGHAITSAPVVLSISLYYHYIITSKVCVPYSRNVWQGGSIVYNP